MNNLFLLLVLVGTVLGMLLPYKLEVAAGVVLAVLALFVLYLFVANKEIARSWRICFTVMAGISAVGLLVFLVWHRYGGWYLAVGANLALCLLGFIYSALLRRGQGKLWFAGRLAAGLLVIVAGLVVGAVIYSHAVFHRSVISTIAEWKIKEGVESLETAMERWQKGDSLPANEWEINASLFDCAISETTEEGMRTYWINQRDDDAPIILYIHGGYYMNEANDQEMYMLARIIERTDAMVIMPLYTVGTHGSIMDSFDGMLGIYSNIKATYPNRKLTVMGDSAGGGYALAVAEGLKEKDMTQPDALVLLSPWTDLTMENPEIQALTSIDPVVSLEKTKYAAEAWSGELDLKDWRVSPMYGDLGGLKNVLIMSGTREILYPDCVKLQKMMEATGTTESWLVVASGQNHVYPCFPTLEGRIAVEEISKVVQFREEHGL